MFLPIFFDFFTAGQLWMRWLWGVFYADLLRQNSPRVSCEHVLSPGLLCALVDHFYKRYRRTYVTPLPSRLSLRQICDLIRMNIRASFTFCREFVENSFMNYEEYTCRLSTSAKSHVYSGRDFIVFYKFLFFGPTRGLEGSISKTATPSVLWKTLSKNYSPMGSSILKIK